jgi:hypothetical protein
MGEAMATTKVGVRSDEYRSDEYRSARAPSIDALPIQAIRFGEHWLPTYLLSGGAGVTFGSLAFTTLALLRREHPLLAFGMVGLLIGCFLSFGLLRRLVTGSETHVLLEHWLFALAIASLALRLASLPVLPWLDLLTIAYSIVFAFGRLGCTLSGCCHGILSSIGLRYDGVRRFPVQPLEGVLWLCLAAAAMALSSSSLPGTAFGWTCVSYGVLRPILERFRSDPRPHIGPLSESDVLSILLFAVGVGVFIRLRPLQPREMSLVGLGLASGLLALATHRRWLTLERIAAPLESGIASNTVTVPPEGSSAGPSTDTETIFDAIRGAMVSDALTATPRTFTDRGLSLAASKIALGDDGAALLVSVPRASMELGRAETLFRALATFCDVPRSEPLTTLLRENCVVCALPWQGRTVARDRREAREKPARDLCS